MTFNANLLRDQDGAAASEMVLVLPLLLILLFGSVELGHYLYNEHILVKAVRDGARFAARHDFSLFEDSSGGTVTCNSTPEGDLVGDTRELIMTSLLSDGEDRLADWEETTIDVAITCENTAGSESLSGIYEGRDVGAPIVTITALVPYTPLFSGAFGFSGQGYELAATQQAVVVGI